MFYASNFDDFFKSSPFITSFFDLNTSFKELNLAEEPNFKFTTHTTQTSKDEQLVKSFSKDVIAGYLNLGFTDGWDEGSDVRIGYAFTRIILLEYVKNQKQEASKNKEVFEKVFASFFGDESNFDVIDNIRPRKSRACCDVGITGWKGHATSRIVGNLSNEYQPSKPFFEIIINSARNSADDPNCQPYTISIHDNEQQLDERRKNLASINSLPEKLAYHIYYPSYLKSPKYFFSINQSKLGPNSTRIIEGLTFLENKTINAQKVGNCWIKQPMRCLLAILYLEIYSTHKELNPSEAWNQALTIYKSIQKSVAIPYVEELVKKTNVSQNMLESAQKAIIKQKSL